jgi:hypothetical protein
VKSPLAALFASPYAILVRSTLATGLLAMGAPAQVSLEWSATQPDNSGDEFTQALAVGPDGSVYLAQQIPGNSSANTDVRIVKLSSSGAFAWLAEWDTYGFSDTVTTMLTAPNGDLFVGGVARRETAIGHINHDATLRKFSPGGTQQWFGASQGVGGTAVSFRALARLSNGAVIGAGAKGAGGHLARFSNSGALEWQRTLTGGGFGGTWVTDVAVLPDDSIVACGQRGSSFNGALTVWRYDAAGNELWRSTLDELVPQQSGGASLCITPSGRIAVGGRRQSPTLVADMALAQFDPADGSLDWKLYVSANSGPSGMDEISKVAATPDGVIWCAGRRFDTQSDMDTVILRVDGGGALLSLETWAGGATSYDQPQSLHVGSAGQAWVSVLNSGLPNRDITVLQFDSAGELVSESVFDLGGSDFGSVAAYGPGEQLTVAGATDASGDYDLLALRLDLSDAPSGYCTAKVNSLGCAPRLSFNGAPSASATSGFDVVCANMRNQKSGLWLYSLTGPDAAPFQGGFLCTASPRRRTPVTGSGGATGGDDCSGTHVLDFNAFAHGLLGGAPAPELLVSGTSVHTQVWARDPGSLGNSALSAGLRFETAP